MKAAALIAGLVVMGAGGAGAHPLAAQAPRLAFEQPSDSVVPDSVAEPVVVELQIGRLASRTVAAYRVRSEALLPLTQFLQLAEVLFRLSPEGRLEATLDPGRVRLVIDAARDTMSLGAHRVRLEPEFRRFVDGEIYVGAERLGDLLGLLLHVDWAELTVTVMDPGTLPVARRLRRESARTAFLRRGDGPMTDLSLGLERPRWDGLVFDYSLLAPSQNTLGGGMYTAALGGDALGGSLQVGVRSVGPLDSGAVRFEGSWNGVWHDPRLAQVRLGTGITTGPRPRPQNGVLVTNAPFVRPSLVGAMPFGGRLEPGWSIEAYRGGDLVAYDSTDALGRFLMELPVRYGENPVDFVAYGPFGEMREFNRTYRLLESLLPSRRFEYGVSGGACVDADCDAIANVDLRYGLSRRWTVAAGADRVWRPSAPDLFHPYAALTGAPTNDWGITVEAVGDAYTRASVQYEPSLAVSVAAEATAFDRGVVQPMFTDGSRRSQWLLTGFVRPAPQRGYFFFDASLAGERTVAGSTLKGRIGASALTGIARLLPYVRFDRQSAAGVSTTQTFVGLSAFVLPRPQWGPVLGRIWMRATAELERVPGFTTASLVMGRDLVAGVRLETGANWSRGGGVGVVLTLASYLPSVRALTTVDVPYGRATSATQFVQGSVLWDRAAGRLAAAPGPSLERAGLAGHVFQDENGDGRWQPGEPPVVGARVFVGTLTAVSDSNGAYRVWDLIPFEPVVVRVDSISLDSPLLVPALGTVSVVPGPNRFRALDVPIATAGVIEGRVVRGEGSGRKGVAGVTLILTDRRRGTARRLVTFSDGDFYLLGVIAGEYELRVDPRSLEALGMTADPLPLTLAPTADGVGRSEIVIALTPTN
jgi:hypothetical protein